MNTKCPSCRDDVLPSIDPDEFDFNYDGDEAEMICPICGLPLAVEAFVGEVQYNVRANAKFVKDEKEKYEKRMEGDWS